MRRVSLTVCAAALATLAGCGGYDTVTPVGSYSTGTVVTPAPVVTTPAPPVAVAPSATVVQPGTVVAPGTTVVAPGTAVVASPVAGVHPGVGRVESNTRLSQASGLNPPVRRLGLRMDDGTVQFVDTQAQSIEIGDRVELTADNHIRYGFPR